MLCFTGCGESVKYFVTDGAIQLPMCESCAKNAELQGFDPRPLPIEKAR